MEYSWNKKIWDVLGTSLVIDKSYIYTFQNNAIELILQIMIPKTIRHYVVVLYTLWL